MKAEHRLVLIAAVADNGTIGRAGDLPWRLPDDLKRFRKLTFGHTILMGRKTWASLGKPLDGRRNWVLTRDADFLPPAGVEVFSDLSQALAQETEGELLIIGGAQLYQQTLPFASRLELTRVHATVDGDTFFPSLDSREWREIAREEHQADARHAHDFAFVTLQRHQGEHVGK